MNLTLRVNRRTVSLDLEGWESLLTVLRDHLGLPGAKPGCEQGECGSCSVIMDGEVVCSCLVMAADAEGSNVVTVEGLGTPERLHPVQQAFLEHGAVQCGYCTPGLVVAAAHLLDTHPSPTRDEIREALAGNICRCTGYGALLRAIESLGSRA